MILPTKHIPEGQSLLGIGAVVLNGIDKSQTITSLWEKVRQNPVVGTFERFILALDLLYILAAIVMNEGMIDKADT